MTETLGEVLQRVTARLAAAGVDDPARDARLLAAQVMALDPGRVMLHLPDVMDDEQAAALLKLGAERCRRIPLSHLLGRRAFYKHHFLVTPDVLDPRPETETLIETALTEPFQNVLDLGTGSGCILLSLLAARPETSGIGTDMSAAALDVASRNATALGVADRAMFLRSDWFSQVDGRFDLIVSNPPYIASEDMADLEPELHHEPRLALTDEANGLTCYTWIVPEAADFLRPGGRLMVEIGHTQGREVGQMFRAAGFRQVQIFPDLDGRDRVVCGRVTA